MVHYILSVLALSMTIEYSSESTTSSNPGPTCENEVFVCEGRRITLDCTSVNGLVAVVYAHYGRLDTSICNNKFATATDCTYAISQSAVDNFCAGQSKCQFMANNRFFGDMCHGVSKYLHVIYGCQSNDSNWLCPTTSKTTSLTTTTTATTSLTTSLTTSSTTSSTISSTTMTTTTTTKQRRRRYKGCECTCSISLRDLNNHEVLKQLLEEMNKRLKVKKEDLSKNKRSKISVMENRPTSQAFGWVSVLLISLVFAVIVIPDLINFLKFVNVKRMCRANSISQDFKC